MPNPPPGVPKSDANPCGVGVPSWCGFPGVDQVRPSSFDQASLTLYASAVGSLPSSHCAAIVLSPRRSTDGTSAQLPTIISLLATVRVADHPPAVCSEKLSAGFVCPLSIQLRIAPCAEVVKRGCALCSDAGDCRAVMTSGVSGTAWRWHPAAATATDRNRAEWRGNMHLSYRMFAPVAGPSDPPASKTSRPRPD